MTMENISVTMIRENLDAIPQFAFPRGFGIRTMQPGDERLWTDVQRDAEPHFAIADDLFAKQFGANWDDISERCFLLTAENAEAVGTISAWFSDDFRGEESWGRIHWVAVRPAFQGRGLARAGLTHALNFLAARHKRAFLDTSTARLAALKLYLDFGFVPDRTVENADAAWRLVSAYLSHAALTQEPRTEVHG